MVALMTVLVEKIHQIREDQSYPVVPAHRIADKLEIPNPGLRGWLRKSAIFGQKMHF
jgi:hypothetical protein